MFRRQRSSNKKNTKKTPEEQQAETNKFNVTLLSNIYAKLLHEIVPGRELEFPLLDQRDSKIYGELFGSGQNVTVRNFRGVIAAASLTSSSSVHPHESSSNPNNNDDDNNNNNNSTHSSTVLSIPSPTSTSSSSPTLTQRPDENADVETTLTCSIETHEKNLEENYLDEMEETHDEERQTEMTSQLLQPSEISNSLLLNNEDPDAPTSSPNVSNPAPTTTTTPDDNDHRPTIIPIIPNKRLEKVIHLIHSIGELIARENIPKNSSTQSPVFEYFSEKNILSFFIDLAKAKKAISSSSSSNIGTTSSFNHTPVVVVPFDEIVYTSSVKCQILKTCSTLLSYASSTFDQHPDRLYFLLSHNFMNELISSFIPLEQWSEEALQEIISHYISFLETLVGILKSYPKLGTLLVQQKQRDLIINPSLLEEEEEEEEDDNGKKNDSDILLSLSNKNQSQQEQSYFPIFHACVELITSTRQSILQSEDIQETLKQILLQLCTVSSSTTTKISSSSNPIVNRTTTSSSNSNSNPLDDDELDLKHMVETRMDHCIQDLKLWIQHLCNQVTILYNNLTQHLMGTFHGDEVRIALIQKDIEFLQKLYRYMNDILWGRISSLNTLLCESLLEKIVYPIWLQDLFSYHESLGKNNDDNFNDQINVNLAKSQAAMYMTTQLFMNMDYRPLVKMVATAILHPYAPTESYVQKQKNSHVINSIINDVEPTYTSFLNRILHGRDEMESTDYNVNPCRNEIIRLLRGDCGDYRFIIAAMMLESILDSATMDPDFLSDITLFPPLDQEKDISIDSESVSSTRYPYPFEDALGLFYMKRLNIATSPFTILAMDCATSLLLSFLNHSLERIKMVSTDVDQMSRRFRESSIIRGVFVSRRLYAMEALKYQKLESVGQKIMANLVDMEIARLYKLLKVGKGSIYASDLERQSVRSLKQDWRVLLAKEPSLPVGDIDKARMAVHMILRLKILCKVLRELHDKFAQMLEKDESFFGSSPSDGFLNARIVCEADGPILDLLGGYRIRPQLGNEIEIRGKTVFTFYKPSKESTSRRHELIFLIDMDDVFVVKPHILGNSGKGSILFMTRLRDILTAAADGTCIHLAMRPPKEENGIFKNGTLEMKFDSEDTCLIVKEILEQKLSVLMDLLSSQITKLLDSCIQDSFASVFESR